MERPDGTELSAALFGVITPTEVLLEYDGPRFFTCQLEQLGTYALAFFCAEGEFTRYLIVPTTDEIVQGLESGSLSIRESLTRTASRPWVVDVELASGAAHQAWSVSRARIPAGYLPEPGVMLRRELQPLLSVRMEGPELQRGSTPRDAVIHAFQNIPGALKRLLDHVLEREDRKGRPEDWVRALYGMPAQRFAFGSFEVAYRRPQILLVENEDAERALTEVGLLLEKALSLAAGNNIEMSEKEREAVFDAAHRLSPPSRGTVLGATFGGSMLSREARQHRVTQASRRRVARLRGQTKVVDIDPFFELSGRVGEIDFDALTFQLRDVADLGSVTIQFEVDFQDLVIDAGTEATMIRVIGHREADEKRWLLAVLPAPENRGKQHLLEAEDLEDVDSRRG